MLVIYSVQRGTRMAKEEECQLALMKFDILRSSPFPIRFTLLIWSMGSTIRPDGSLVSNIKG
jgi:hypothetical protein